MSLPRRPIVVLNALDVEWENAKGEEGVGKFDEDEIV